MTRLTTNDIQAIRDDLFYYDRELTAKTGASLADLAGSAAGLERKTIEAVSGNISAAVVPVTSGLGIIPGFCDAIAAIVSYLGVTGFVTRSSDVGGLAEAFEKQADIIFLGDDARFIAIHVPSRLVVDNAEATAKGFVAGLSLMAGGLDRQHVLVLGCGAVGAGAVKALVKRNVRVSVYDIDPDRVSALRRIVKQRLNHDIFVLTDPEQALLEHRYIVDATPAGNIIHARHVKPDTIVCAPGIPCGLTVQAGKGIRERILHDPLQIGVATMLFDALSYQVRQ